MFTSGSVNTLPRMNIVLQPTKLWNWTLSWMTNLFNIEKFKDTRWVWDICTLPTVIVWGPIVGRVGKILKNLGAKLVGRKVSDEKD